MRRIIKYFLLGVLLSLISACYDSEASDITIEKGVAQTVTFTLNSSENSGGTSSTTDNENITGRSLTENEENTLNTANVLAFVDDGADNYSFSYRVPGRDISTPSSGTTTFKVDLKQYPNKQLFVILANSNSEIIAAGISIGEPLETALSKLVTSCSTEWPARNNGDALLRHIPMYGKTAGIVINSATTDVGSITLVRMLARIDVRVESTVTNFQLKEVCVFNRKDRGFIAYKDASWDKINQLVTCADVPENALTTKLNNILYQANSEHKVLRSIYTFEACGVTDKKDATAIVVGGYFDYLTNQSKVSYYRVDIPEYDSNGKQLPGTMGDILRNHLYDVEIQKVTNKGYDTPEEAFNGVIKVDANIVPWNLATIDEVKYEGTYSLKVSRTVCSYLTDGASNEKLVIETDYLGNWEGILYPASATSWIQWHEGTVFNDKGNLTGAAGVTTLNFDVTANAIGQSRHAFLKIIVGGLTKYIDFYQTNLIGNVMDWVNDTGSAQEQFDGPYRLGVSRTEYPMSKNAVTGLELIVSTDCPKGWTSSIEPADTDWLTITENGTSSGPGDTTLKFNLKENNTFYDRFARIIIKTGNLRLKKEIYVSQNVFSLSSGEINLTPWDGQTGGWDKDTQINEFYFLSTSKTAYPLSTNAQTLPLTITTDFPKGWTTSIEPIGTDWLTITENGSSSGAGTKILKFDLKENNMSSDRSACIIVKAGNLKKTIYVSQNVLSTNSGIVNATPWDDDTGWDKDTQFNGYYFLSSDKAFYTLFKNAQQGIPLVISTNHPDKWKASVTGGNSWLSITDDGLSSATVSGNVTTGALKFNIGENNTQLDRTEGEITISSGSLKKVIRIQQNSDFYPSVKEGIINWQTDPINDAIGIKNRSLALSRVSCKYDSSGKTRTLTVTGSGGGSWKASVSSVNGADSWITLTTATGTANGTGTELKYTIKPNTGSATRSAKIRVTLYNLCKEILIEQYPDAAIGVSNIKDSYRKDDSVIQSFTVTSRAPWKAAVTSDAGNLVQQLRNSSGLANTTGEEFRFTLNTISGSVEYKADITFSSIDGEFEPYTVNITGK